MKKKPFTKLTRSTQSLTDQSLGRVKVHAELVEHHVNDGENNYLPDLKEEIEAKQEFAMIGRLIALRKRSPHRPTSEHAEILA